MLGLSEIEDRFELHWRFETPRYTVAMWAEEEEDMRPEDSFQFPEDIAFASDGEPAHWFCAFVGVFDAEGECVGYDLLGGCSYNSFAEFCGNRTGWRKGAKLVTGGYFADMVRQAVSQARAREALVAA